MLQSLTEELESAQHANQSFEQQLFELRERHVMGAEVEQKQLQAEAEVCACVRTINSFSTE